MPSRRCCCGPSDGECPESKYECEYCTDDGMEAESLFLQFGTFEIEYPSLGFGLLPINLTGEGFNLERPGEANGLGGCCHYCYKEEGDECFVPGVGPQKSYFLVCFFPALPPTVDPWLDNFPIPNTKQAPTLLVQSVPIGNPFGGVFCPAPKLPWPEPLSMLIHGTDQTTCNSPFTFDEFAIYRGNQHPVLEAPADFDVTIFS